MKSSENHRFSDDFKCNRSYLIHLNSLDIRSEICNNPLGKPGNEYFNFRISIYQQQNYHCHPKHTNSYNSDYYCIFPLLLRFFPNYVCAYFPVKLLSETQNPTETEAIPCVSRKFFCWKFPQLCSQLVISTIGNQ